MSNKATNNLSSSVRAGAGKRGSISSDHAEPPQNQISVYFSTETMPVHSYKRHAVIINNGEPTWLRYSEFVLLMKIAAWNMCKIPATKQKLYGANSHLATGYIHRLKSSLPRWCPFEVTNNRITWGYEIVPRLITDHIVFTFSRAFDTTFPNDWDIHAALILVDKKHMRRD
jgi:hypothetical protein